MKVVYDLGNLAEWLTAVGTISAVITSLYLASANKKPKAKVKSFIGYGVLDHGGLSKYPYSISANITNTGSVPIHLKKCTLEYKGNEMFFPDNSHSIDHYLKPGESIEHTLPFEGIYNYMVKENMNSLKTYIFFADGAGKKYKARINIFL